mgnify:CR=1 FL=1
METFEVILTKSYIVTVEAEDKIKAKEFAEFFTSDIENISTAIDEFNYNCKIKNIDCKINEAIEI